MVSIQRIDYVFPLFYLINEVVSIRENNLKIHQFMFVVRVTASDSFASRYSPPSIHIAVRHAPPNTLPFETISFSEGRRWYTHSHRNGTLSCFSICRRCSWNFPFHSHDDVSGCCWRFCVPKRTKIMKLAEQPYHCSGWWTVGWPSTRILNGSGWLRAEGILGAECVGGEEHV